MTMGQGTPLLEMRNISKTFGSVNALKELLKRGFELQQVRLRNRVLSRRGG